MSNSAKGLKLALLASVISGVSVFLNKFAVASLPDPVLLPAIKNSIVGAIFMLIFLGSRSTLGRHIKSLDKLRVVQLLAVGVVGGFMPFYMFFTGLSQIPASNANIIHKTLVIWVALLSPMFLKEKITKTQALAVLGLFASNLIPGGFKGLAYSKGELLILLATVLWSMEVVLVKKLSPAVETKLLATSRMALGSIFLLLSVVLKDPSNLTAIRSFTVTQWFWIVLTSLTLFGYVYCWYYALKFSPAIQVTAILVFSTIITNILSAVFITHSWNFHLNLQTATIIVSLLTLLVPLGSELQSRLTQVRTRRGR